MKTFLATTTIVLTLLAFAGTTAASNEPELLPNLINVNQVISQPPAAAKAVTDSLYLLGGPGVLSGKFQTEAGLPDRQGWTGLDHTQESEIFWQVSTFNAADLDPETADNHAWWCGDYFEPCNEDDPAEGYGDNWAQYMDWYGTVPNPNTDVTVRIQAVISYDIEPGEEYLHLGVDNSEHMENLISFTYQASAEVIDITTTLTPAYFVGPSGDEVHLRWAFYSDGAWSDEDCRWPTAGAAQIDLINVSFDQGGGPIQIGSTETCEPGDPLQWQPTVPQGAGDFSKVWPLLDDADPTSENNTPQFAFIDDGVVVPGTGGFPCTTHCYGPGGFIVNPAGGISDLYVYVYNEILSPVLAVPGGDWNAGIFSFDQYIHAELNNGDPYVLGIWHVRSTADPTGETGWSPWLNNNLALWGDARYVRSFENVTHLLVPGFTHVQLALGVIDYHYGFSTNGTPAPYYDNVSFKVYNNLEPSALLVRPDGSGDYPTIQAAINAAADQDTVLLTDGIYSGEGNRDMYFMGKEVVVASQSRNPENCIIDVEGGPNDLHRGFLFTSEEGPGSVITGVTITGGYMDLASTSLTYSGGAIACRAGSSPTIDNCIFTGNSAVGTNQQGGAIFCDDASPLISHCIFDGNTAVNGGAIGATDVSSLVVSHCLFVGNEALTSGAGIFAHDESAHITISSSTFQGNISPVNNGTLASLNNGQFEVDHTILAFAVSGYSAFIPEPGNIQFSCSNLYGNPGGDWRGHFVDQLGVDGNISLDPLFCLEDNPGQPFGIHEGSPCGPAFNPDCGLIGSLPIACGSASTVGHDNNGIQQVRLFSCYPNPFNPRTKLSFNLTVSSPVELRIYSLDGRLVSTLIDEVLSAGTHETYWNGRDQQGRAVASGVFFCRMRAGSYDESIRLLLLR
jgi:predicted outer membrane repeat protein